MQEDAGLSVGQLWQDAEQESIFDEIAVIVLLGKTMTAVDRISSDLGDVIMFTGDTGEQWKMHHLRGGYATVYLDDIAGDLNDLVGTPITMAELVTNRGNPKDPEWHDSSTWTFYKLATVKGYVTIRWYGTSNGWYSEDVSFHQIAH